MGLATGLRREAEVRWDVDFSIRQKLQAIVMVTSAAALLVASVAFTLYDRSMFLRAKTQDLAAVATMIGSNSTAAVTVRDARSAADILSALQTKQNVTRACIYDKAGRLFASYSRDTANGSCSPSPAQVQAMTIIKQNMVLFQPMIGNGQSIGTIVIETDLNDLAARLTRFLEIDFLVCRLPWPLRSCCRPGFSGSSRARSAAADTALSVSSRANDSIRARKRSDDEIGLLFDQFNSMLDRIQQGDIALQEVQDELERRVAERTSYLNALIDNSPLAIMVLDADQKVQLCNPAFQHLFQCVPGGGNREAHCRAISRPRSRCRRPALRFPRRHPGRRRSA